MRNEDAPALLSVIKERGDSVSGVTCFILLLASLALAEPV
jgi:hypothetical protein